MICKGSDPGLMVEADVSSYKSPGFENRECILDGCHDFAANVTCLSELKYRWSDVKKYVIEYQGGWSLLRAVAHHLKGGTRRSESRQRSTGILQMVLANTRVPVVNG